LLTGQYLGSNYKIWQVWHQYFFKEIFTIFLRDLITVTISDPYNTNVGVRIKVYEQPQKDVSVW